MVAILTRISLEGSGGLTGTLWDNRTYGGKIHARRPKALFSSNFFW
jgi:hypothetical protein